MISPTSGQCISEDDFCQNQFGYNAEYDSLRDNCRCKSSYVLNSSKTGCISGDSYCQEQLGYYSSYDSYSRMCECDSGYELVNGKCQEETTLSVPLYVPPPRPPTPPLPPSPAKPKIEEVKTAPKVEPVGTSRDTKKIEVEKQASTTIKETGIISETSGGVGTPAASKRQEPRKGFWQWLFGLFK